jgi:hypothetical protein
VLHDEELRGVVFFLPRVHTNEAGCEDFQSSLKKILGIAKNNALQPHSVRSPSRYSQSDASSDRVGESVIESVITKRSAEEMGLKKADLATAVVKATEVRRDPPSRAGNAFH